MREIEFKGISENTHDWVYGSLIYSTMENQYYIAEHNEEELQYPVFAETVGQYTGLKDKNGKQIFEGDIITCINTTRQGYNIGQKMCGFIEYEKYGCYWFCKNNFQHYNDWVFADDIEVIGNIHDNPELLEN